MESAYTGAPGEAVFPRELGRRNGKILVEISSGVERCLTEAEWADCQNPGAGSRLIFRQALESFRSAARNVDPAEVREALADLMSAYPEEKPEEDPDEQNPSPERPGRSRTAGKPADPDRPS